MKTTCLITIDSWEKLVEQSYAHNSALYQNFEASACGETILRFLRWDAEQPPFYRFLELWLPKAPQTIAPALVAHINEEIEGKHSQLFSDMLTNILKHFPFVSPKLNHSVLGNLNYTFSEECALKESFPFFCGSFFATELMSAKRCEQLYRGLTRLGVPGNDLEYLKIHYQDDKNHVEEVKRDFLAPLILQHPEEIEAGIRDRLNRSEKYLRWYEVHGEK